MNHIITPASVLTPLLPSLDAIAVARGRQTGTRYELEDSVLRGIGWAEDIGPEAAPLHAQATQLLANKAAADAAARAAAEADAAAAALLYVPRAITNADLRRGLIAVGINPQLITDYLSSLPDGAAKWTALADWEYSNYVERAHPMLDQLAPSFGLTSTDIDAIFKSKPEYPLIGP